jgi:hypothetical protein
MLTCSRGHARHPIGGVLAPLVASAQTKTLRPPVPGWRCELRKWAVVGVEKWVRSEDYTARDTECWVRSAEYQWEIRRQRRGYCRGRTTVNGRGGELSGVRSCECAGDGTWCGSRVRSAGSRKCAWAIRRPQATLPTTTLAEHQILPFEESASRAQRRTRGGG